MALSLVLVGLALILGLGAINRAEAQVRHEKSGRPCPSIGIVTNFTDNSLYLLDPETNTLCGPYLKGELGQGDSAINTAVSPGGKTAIITNYNAYAVFFVELPHRFGDSPTLLDSVNIGYNAEDVTITPDGKYALITYGGSDPFIAVLELETRSLRTIYEMPSAMKTAGIEIAPDGQTVLAVDHTNTCIHVLTLDIDGNLTFSHSIALTFQPGDISVSPDGMTAVVVNPSEGSPAVLRIDSPGNVVLVEENISLSCPYGAAAAFSSNGTAAFYLSNNGPTTSIHLLEVHSPGIVSSSGTSINISPGIREGEVRSEFDSLAVGPVGHYAYVWRKAPYVGNPAGISVIDLTTQKQVKTLSGIFFPVDITFCCLKTATKPSKPASDQPPFGIFETPVNNSIVRSSIAVTGWALDDVGVESVKIYRHQGSTLVYIGDAVFVEGARPDVAQAYPNYPNNTRAGWGYMMLTNFLPNGGNGTFKIHAIARDTYGHEVTLGIRTIHCDNAHATKPFGAIDVPKQGETISGTNYRIQGWVLTPPPNKIPEDGSTINVFIDEQSIGQAAYNIYRSDIATLFPGYTNSEGALAYFNLDTTQYSNGIHTLE
jgi:DNA-binding beta-propeller fold protein YncE